MTAVAERQLNDLGVPKKHYLPAFDGLRAIAIIAVLLFHATYGRLTGGLLGVDLFFVLSGYLITRLLLQEFEDTGAIRIGFFYARRALRLYPALLCTVLLTGLFWRLPSVSYSTSYLKASTAALFYFGNFVRQDIGALGHTWSLAIEEQFYLFWPFFLFFLVRRAGARGLLTACIILVAGSSLLRAVLYIGMTGSSLDLYAFTPTRIDSLFLGAIGGVLSQTSVAIVRFQQLARRCRIPELLMVTLLVLFCTAKYPAPWLFVWGYTAIAIICLVLIISVAAMSDRTLLLRLLSNRRVVWVGRRSYGLYLYHYPVFAILETLRQPGSKVNAVFISIVRVFTTFLIAELSYRYIELPWLRKKENFRVSEKLL